MYKNRLKELQQTYNEIAAEFDITRYKPWPQTVDFINELPRNGMILDLGCGNGRNIKYLASVDDGFKILGLDFSVRMLRIAKENIRQLGFDENVELILSDVIQMPLKSSILNGAIYVAALHHLPTEQMRFDSLLELQRCLKSGCKAFISVWDFEQERFKNELAEQLAQPPKDGEFGDVYVPWTGKRGAKHLRYYHLFYKNELEELIGRTGLEIENLFRASDNYHAVVRKRV